MRKCVAIDRNGDVVAFFHTLKNAADFYGIPPNRVFKAITQKKIVNDLMWMYEEDYDETIKKGLKEKLVRGGKKYAKKKGHPVTKETKEKIAKTIEKRKEYGKRFFVRNYKTFAKSHIKWMIELKDKWLERGEFGIRPELIADYYENLRDKEVAMLASMFVKMGDECYDMVQCFRSIIGEHPWDWFKNRWFSSNDSLDKIDQQIIPFFNEWWQECFKFGSYDSIGECVKKKCERDGLSYCEMILKISETTIGAISPVRAALFLLVFSDADGLGQDLWHIDKADVKIPVTGDLYSFLRDWAPDVSRYVEPDERIELFGIDSIDFYYCYLAYEDLKKYRPKECSKYATFFNDAYNHRTFYQNYRWKERFPKIDFSAE